MQYLKADTAVTKKLGPFVDKDDGNTTEEALTISQADIRLSKNGGAFAQTNNAAGATHDENGWYGVPLNATDTDTEGTLMVAIHESGALPVWREFTVLSAEIYESLYESTSTALATQDQLNQVANISGVVQRAFDSYVLTSGLLSSGTVSDTEQLNGVRHIHTDNGGVMDLYYESNIGSGLPSSVTVEGYLQGNNDDLEVYGYDWVSASWKQLGVFNGQGAAVNGVPRPFPLLVDMVGSGNDLGKVRVRFTDGAFTLTSAVLAIDRLLVEFSLASGEYEDGAIWLDTKVSNTNTVRGVDGRASNPVSTIAAVNTLLASANLSRIKVAPQSSFTLAATQANQSFLGKNWTLALGGQSISGSYIEGADIAGIGTGAAEIHFDHCHMGAVTLPPCDLEDCILESTFTLGTAGNFFFENCKSGVAGTSTPVLDFGGALDSSNVNFRHYSGGIEIQNMGTGTGTYNMSLEGFGQLVVNANCSDSTVAIRGHFAVTDGGANMTFSDDPRFTLSGTADAVWDEVITGSEHNTNNSAGKRLRQLGETVVYQDGAIWVDTVNGVAGTTVGDNGTPDTPSDSIADALTLAVATGLVRIRVASGSSVTLAAALEGYEIYNCNWTLALGGQSISNSCISGATISGICTGASQPRFLDCRFNNATIPPSHLTRSGFGGTITAGSAGTFIFDSCYSSVAGTGAPVFDFGSGLDASNVNYRHYSGGVEIQSMGAGTGSYNMSLEGFGQLIINANCSATSLVAIRGCFTVTDNASGAVTLSDNARFDITRVVTPGTGSRTVTITVNDDVASALAGVSVWASTDAASANVVAGTLTTNASGQVTMFLDDGTYYVWKVLAGWGFTNPETMAVASGSTSFVFASTGASAAASGTVTGFIADTIAAIRLWTDEPATNPKYSDSILLGMIENSFAEQWLRLSRSTRRQINAVIDISVVSGTLQYILPPVVGEVLELQRLDSADKITNYAGISKRQTPEWGGPMLEGNTLIYHRDPEESYTLRVIYLPSGCTKLHLGAVVASTAIDNTTTAGQCTFILDTSPTTGILDRRPNVYPGSTLRILSATGSNNYIQQRTITAYDVTTSTVTLQPALEHLPTGTVTYEIAPPRDTETSNVVALDVARKVAVPEQQRSRIEQINREYQNAFRALLLSEGSANGINGLSLIGNRNRTATDNWLQVHKGRTNIYDGGRVL